MTRTQPPLRVVFADDHRAFRESVISSLAGTHIDVVAELADGAAALAAVRALRPDVALLDLHMPGLSGAEVARVLRAESSRARVLIFSGFTDREIVDECLLAGAFAFLSKDAATDELVRALEHTANGRRPARDQGA